MEDIFRPQSLTIKALLGNQDALYQIPRYQRPYSWGDEQLDKLWEDLREAQENEPNYFLGSIITAKPEETSRYLDIVDGQQRLTTLLILLCVCRDLYPDLNANILDDDPFAIDPNIIKTSIKYNDRFERLRLKTHSNHSSDFDQLILKDEQSIKNKKPLKKDLSKAESPQYKFLNTSSFFKEKLEGLGKEETGIFINYLFNNVKIIRIDCHSVSFAIKLFQVLNDRGLDLSNSDLIKSYLIGKIHKKYESDPEVRRQKEDQFMDDWKCCEEIGSDVEQNMNSFFVIYEYYLLGKNPEKSLYDELVRLFEHEDPNSVVKDFKNFITLYKEEIYHRHDAVMYSFYYLRWGMYWRSIVLSALHTEYEEYEDFLFVLRRYFYINWMAGNTLTRIKQTSFNLITWIKTKKPLSEIKELLDKQLSTETKAAINNLNGAYMYYEVWCKPLLFLIEYQQLDKMSRFKLSDRQIQIEHIIPIAYKKNVKWNCIDKLKDANSWIHSGANLTLLSGSKNIAASNDSFEKKIQSYDGTVNYDNSDHTITSFIITQKIVNDYKGAKFDKEWGVKAINDRWQWFCIQVEKLFDIDLSELKEEVIELEE